MTRQSLAMAVAAPALLYAGLLSAPVQTCQGQTTTELHAYFKESIGLSEQDLAQMRGGKAVAKVLKSRTPAEIFVFGAIYIKAVPESYFHLATDFERLRKLPEYVALGKFSSPPQTGDLEGFSFTTEDVEALKKCKPRDCEVQIPAEAIEDFRKSINWKAPDVERQVNQLLRQRALERLGVYQREGNQALGVYLDKDRPTDVHKQFQYLLSYVRALPKYLPEFHRYLLAYPNSKPANTEDSFYWANVKFGLKPTLRIIHLVTMRGQSPTDPAYVIAEKQLYSSHYFETALDLTFCIRDDAGASQPGFYLVKAMGSEQAGLTGFKGSIVRKVAVGRTASSLEKSLNAIRNTLEQKH